MATRIGFAEVSSLPDPLLQYQFQLIVPNIPGQGSGRGLSLRCMTAVIPGEELEDVLTTLHGIDLKSAGRPIFNHDMPVTFLETRDMFTRDALRNWVKYAKDIRTGTGHFKSEYATSGFMELYDDANNLVRSIKLVNFFCKQYEDISVDGSSSAPVNNGAVFSYDIHTE